MSERKISAAGVSEDQQGNDRILTQRLATNPVTTWTKVYNFVKGLFYTAYLLFSSKLTNQRNRHLCRGICPCRWGFQLFDKPFGELSEIDRLN